MRIFVGFECSGQMRRVFERRGHDVISCDLLPAEDGAANHRQGDIFETLDALRSEGWTPDMAIFHPPCTYHANSAAWAFSDPDFEKYPDKGGYHQQVKPGTLVGLARRLQRESDERDVEKLKKLPFFKAIENPRNTWDKRTTLGKPHDTTQPYEFGADASKETTFRFFDGNGDPVPLKLTRYASRHIMPRAVCPDCLQSTPRGDIEAAQLAFSKGCQNCGKTSGDQMKARWGNQTDSGQNNIGPREGRAGDRARTYEGIAVALADCVLSHALKMPETGK